MKETKLLLIVRIIIACVFSLSLYFNISEMNSIKDSNIRNCEIKKLYLRSGRRSNSSIVVEYANKNYFVGVPRNREGIFDSISVGKRYNFYFNKDTDTLFIKDENNYKLTIFIGFIFALTFIPKRTKM